MFRRILIILILAASTHALLAEKILMKDGSVIEGTIVQQTRTTIQVRTPAGQVLTLQKDAIRKIEYGNDPRQEEKRREELRKKELEAEKKEKARVETERLEKEKREKNEERERKEREQQANSRKDATRPDGWWLEPFLATGRGSFRSVLETVYDRYQQGEEIYGFLLPQPLPSFTSEQTWNYSHYSPSRMGLRGGKGRWLGEAEVLNHRARADFPQIVRYEYTPSDSSTYLYGVHADRIRESHTSLRVGYEFYVAPAWSFTAYAGTRKLAADANYTAVGQIQDIGPGYAESAFLFSPGSAISLSGQGREAAIEGVWKESTLPLKLTGRVTAFQQRAISKLTDAVVIQYASSPLSYADINVEEGRYLLNGSVFALRGTYTVKGTDLFLEYSSMKTSARLKGISSRLYATVIDDGTIFQEDPQILLSLMFYNSAYSPVRARAQLASGFSFGVSRRFWL